MDKHMSKKPLPDKSNHDAIARHLRSALDWRAEHPEFFPEDQVKVGGGQLAVVSGQLVVEGEQHG